MKKYVVLKRLHSRQGFALPMTDDEIAILQQHIEKNWKGYLALV